ncbi:MAG TPA: hypothetical protein VG346_00675 [Acidimicrobiales bacterium]|jgi:hypothetical protein|nr:hypothetical protein [Acidimicrobiales bacterium]
MSTDVIGSRYHLGSVVTCTPEATTWRARDTWLGEPVLVVMPEPGCGTRFAALARAVVDHASAHLLGLYDIGNTLDQFVVFGVPAATFSEDRAPREEEDVLVAGRDLGDALDALHERGVVHGDLHPGSVAVTESGVAALSPWPLAPRPQNWSGPGGFGGDPEEWRDVAVGDDVRALGAVLLGALAGPPVLSSEQIGNVERELADRAPSAVAIAGRALTPPTRGGYADAAEVRDDCAAALSGELVVAALPDAATPSHVDVPAAHAAHSARDAELSEGRRAAVVVAVAVAAVLAGLGLSGALGASAPSSVHPITTHASGCVARSVGLHCSGAGPAAPQAVTSPGPAVRARLADHPVSSGSGGSLAAHGATAPSTVAATSTTGPSSPASTTTTVPSSTTTSSSTTSSTTTSTSPPTSTTAPTSTTTSSSVPGSVQAGPDGDGDSLSGSSGSGSSGWGGGR